MRIAFFSVHNFDEEYFNGISSHHQFTFIKEKLDSSSVHLANGHQVVCVFVHDKVNERVLELLAALDVKLVITRSSGVDNIDFDAAQKYGIDVKWLPGFSPEAIAEHAVALLLALSRKTHIAYKRVMQGDFSIEGLQGFNLNRKVVGIIGMGRIGYAFARIMKGFGCTLLANDMEIYKNIAAEGIEYTSVEDLLKRSDIISLHCSLNNSSLQIINSDTIKLIKPGVVLINTSRGNLVDVKAILEALRNKRILAYGADVYSNEGDFFYQKFDSLNQVRDPLLKELVNHPNVLITPHEGFFTTEAMQQIAKTVITELNYYEEICLDTNSKLIV